MYDKVLEEFIIGQSGNSWPRGLGNPYRGSKHFSYIARSCSDTLKFMRGNKYTNVFMTVYSFSEYNDPKTDAKNAIIDCIPFDFDAVNIATALNDVRFVTEWCRKFSSILPIRPQKFLPQ